MDGGGSVPLSAVPILLQILSTPNHYARDEVLTLLCDLVGSAYGAEGAALGASIRESGGLLTLSWLLVESDPSVQKQALYIIANLASDAVDPLSHLTKSMLLQCEAEYRLLPCLDSDDDEVLSYACAAVQNLCHDAIWSRVLLDQDVVGLLEELLDNKNEQVQHYAAGAIKNVVAAAAAIKAQGGGAPGKEVPISLVSEAALLKVEERARNASLKTIQERIASRKIQRNVRAKAKAKAISARNKAK